MALPKRSMDSTGNKGKGGNNSLLVIGYKARDECRELELGHGKMVEDNLHETLTGVARGVSRKTA